MSSDLSSIADLPHDAVVLVLRLLARAFDYCVSACSTVANFGSISSSDVQLVPPISANRVGRWKNRRALLKKYVGRMEHVVNHHEMMVVFENLWDFVRPQFVDLLRLFETIETHDAGEFHRTKNLLFLALFVDSNCISILKYLADPQLVSHLASLTIHNLDQFHLPDSFELHKKTIAHVTGAIESSSSVWKLVLGSHMTGSLHRKSVRCFELSMAKELAFDPRDEDRPENSILNKILKNEQGESPESFDEEQCRILDFNQILTVHCSSLPLVYGLTVKSIALTSGKSRHFIKDVDHPIYHELGVLTSLELLLTDLKTGLEQKIDRLVQAGTLGLSKWHSVVDGLNMIHEFNTATEPYADLHRKLLQHSLSEPACTRKASLFKEEDHFVKILGKYRQQITKFLHIVCDGREPQAQEKLNIDVLPVEEVDLAIRDTYYTLAYFDQRFLYELEILRTLDQDSN